MQKEIESLQRNLSNISSNSDESAQKLKEDYLQKLNLLESQVSSRHFLLQLNPPPTTCKEKALPVL